MQTRYACVCTSPELGAQGAWRALTESKALANVKPWMFWVPGEMMNEYREIAYQFRIVIHDVYSAVLSFQGIESLKTKGHFNPGNGLGW